MCEYNNIIREQLKIGMIERVPDLNIQNADTAIHYLPHSAVIRPDAISKRYGLCLMRLRMIDQHCH